MEMRRLLCPWESVSVNHYAELNFRGGNGVRMNVDGTWAASLLLAGFDISVVESSGYVILCLLD